MLVVDLYSVLAASESILERDVSQQVHFIGAEQN
jgi:hypothetical protein